MREDAFRKREKSYEAKYKMDEELRFKAQSRRNKMLGLWAAEKMGMTKDEAAAYAKEVVLVDLTEPGINDVVGKVLKDLKGHNVTVTEADVRQQMERLYPLALEEVARDYPRALGEDHG